MRKVILASASPRRKKLLGRLGIDFDIEESGYEEETFKDLEPCKVAQKLSRKKAEFVAKKHKNAIIIGADTIVVLKNKIIGKPKDKKDARKILKELSSKIHSVITGFTIIDTQKKEIFTDSVETKVYFKILSEKEIEDYIKSEKFMDKAGAYGIQGRGGEFVEKTEGDYLNVVGMPIKALKNGLKKFGIKFHC